MAGAAASPVPPRRWFRRALIVSAAVVALLGAYAAGYGAVRWRAVVTLDTPYDLAAGLHSWSRAAYGAFAPAYAVEVRVRAWCMERWWRPLAALGIADDGEVAGRGTVARYWYRRGFLEGLVSNPHAWVDGWLADPEGVNALGYRRGRFAIDRWLERRLAAAGSPAMIGWQSIPPDHQESRLQLLDADDTGHAIVTASLNELRARMREEGFGGLVDNR